MNRVLVIGSKERRSVLPLSFLRLVQDHTGLGLVEAKQVLDSFASNGAVTVVLRDEETARRFVQAVEALGARCELLA